MAVVALEIKRRYPLAQGIAFGEAGPYEQLEGIVHFAFNPNHPANEMITDLKLAPRDINDMARCSSDFKILKPVRPQHGNQRILMDVANRGTGLALRYLNNTPRVVDPIAPLEPGNGFLMRQGYTVVQCGWEHGVPPGIGLVSIDVPEAVGPDGPLSGKLIFTFQTNTFTQVQGLFDFPNQIKVHRPPLPNNPDDPEAVLTMRNYESAPPQIIPRDHWSFAKLEGNQILPDTSHIYMASGFLPGKVYQILYSTTGAPVVGMGLLAIRDMTSFLRYGTAREGNPCADELKYAYGAGVSQTGAFLRTFLYLGLNEDERGHTVFDGLISHSAGGRRSEFNRRFAQTITVSSRTVSNLFPFTDTEQTEPETGRNDGLLSRLTARGRVPKIFFTNTSYEYWSAFASLIHTDLTDTRDTVPSDSVRVYHFSGTQHGPGEFPPNDIAYDGTRLQYPCNTVDYRPLFRAALVHLDRWVTSGEPPPPSCYPRIDDGTLVPPENIATTFRAIQRIIFPAHLRPLSRREFGPLMEEGIEEGLTPVLSLEVGSFTNLVPAVDDDGNELAGIRLPDISVPLATYTGWNLRHPEIGGPGQLIKMAGSTFPFPATQADREASGDQRCSIEERYTSQENYLEQVKKAAQGLVNEGYLLAEDLLTVIEQAALRYELLRSPVR